MRHRIGARAGKACDLLRQIEPQPLHHPVRRGAGGDDRDLGADGASFRQDRGDGAALALDAGRSAALEEQGAELRGLGGEGMGYLAWLCLAFLGAPQGADTGIDQGWNERRDFLGRDDLGIHPEHAVTRGADLIARELRFIAGHEQIAVLAPFQIGAQFRFQPLPQFEAGQHQRSFRRVPVHGADEAPGTARLLPGDAGFFQHHHLGAAPGEIVGGGTALDAGADHHGVGFFRQFLSAEGRENAHAPHS